jgi:hypothetical protein
MKKIRLNVADLDATEILSRDQLKTVFGGSGSGSDTTTGCPSSGTCSGSCKDSYGVGGTCMTVKNGPLAGCRCATVS